MSLFYFLECYPSFVDKIQLETPISKDALSQVLLKSGEGLLKSLM